MKYFRQPTVSRWVHHVGNAVGIAYPIYLVAAGLIVTSASGGPMSSVDWPYIIFLALLWGSCFILWVNFSTEFKAADNGLYVSFVWKWYCVRWGDIVAIRPLFGFFRKYKSRVVLTNTLTPFHRLYGLLYGLSWKPSFIIDAGIVHQEELVRLIEEHLSSDTS